MMDNWISKNCSVRVTNCHCRHLRRKIKFGTKNHKLAKTSGEKKNHLNYPLLSHIIVAHVYRTFPCSVIQLEQNQFRTFCPNGSWFFRTFWNFLGQIIKARKSLYCGFSSGWGLASLSPFPLQNSVWSLLDFGMINVNFLLLSRGHVFVRCYVQPFTKS